MVVFLVIHDSGYYAESSIEIRGVFATRELAEQVVTLDQTGTASETRPQRWRIGHDASCCSVEETAVQTSLPEVFVLNPEPPPRSEPFVPMEWAYDALAGLQRG